MTDVQQTDKLPKKVKFGLIPQAASEADICLLAEPLQ
jgi:hypothetical protein